MHFADYLYILKIHFYRNMYKMDKKYVPQIPEPFSALGEQFFSI